MALTAPPIATQNFNQIVNEALVRVQVYNPEYTNHLNNSDAGVTILQLFAFLVENLSYVCNQVPDRNKLKFLELLGIPMRAPQAATGVVTFTNERGPLQTVTLQPQTAVLAGSVAFVTQNGLDVLPVEAKIYFRRALTPAEQAAASDTYNKLYQAISDTGAALDFYQTTSFDPPVSASALPVVDLADGSIVDRSLWIALLARAVDATIGPAVLTEIGGKTLTPGFAPSSDGPAKPILPHATSAATSASPLIYEIATGRNDSNGSPIYQPLDNRADANPLEDLTLVQLSLPPGSAMGDWSLGPLDEGTDNYPPAIEDPNIAARVITWIRVRLPDARDAQSASAQKARFNWAGINAAKITQQIPVPVELVGTATGEPDQIYTLSNTPLLPSTLQITVDGVEWKQTDDLLAAPSEVADAVAARVYTADPESGSIRFGTGLQGARPANGAKIFASYAYGGGTAGNTGIGTIKTSPQLPAGFKVTNPLPTRGGDAGETVDEATRRIPLYLQHRDRAVSAADFEDIVRATPGVDLGRAEIVPLFLPGVGSGIPGVVTVLVIPNDPVKPEGPVPDRYFLQAVCNYIEPRRLLTTEVHVEGPDYQDLSVSVGFEIVPGKDIAVVREGVKAAIRTYLSPLTGGPTGDGWPLQKPVVNRELLARGARVDGVADITDVLMWNSAGTAVTSLPISNLQLPRLTKVGANTGAPDDLAPPPAPPPAKRRVPVPVAPPGC